MKNREIYDIEPVAKPRMTRRDKWLKPPRPQVEKYWQFKKLCLLLRVQLPLQGAHVIYILPMPKSWTDKKKRKMEGEPHQQTPDLDNLNKALGDAIYKNDSHIWDLRSTKYWGKNGKIIIYRTENPILQ